MTVSTITAVELARLWDQGGQVDLIDVRTPAEFREIHIPYARNVPLDQLDPQEFAHSRQGDSQVPLYVTCRAGSRGKQACERLVRAGCSRIVNLEGGTLAWEASGLPVIRGKATISLERQVRIAAGSLVLLATILGWLVHPGFAALAAFVGAGLVFAGITDTCGMGMLLARMPWNRAGSRIACRSEAQQGGCDLQEVKS